MPRPGSMMVSGIWLPKCLRSARKIDRPYCTTGGTSLRYLVGKPPPMLTMVRLIPRSAQSRNTWEAIASARSHAFTLRCCEPTWKEMPHGSSPETLGEVEHLDRHLGVAAELPRQRPFGAGAVVQDAAEHLRAGGGTGDLLDLGGAVDREQANAEREGARDVALLLDRIAIGDAVRRRTRSQRHLDLGDGGGVEAGAHRGEQVQHFRRGIGLHRVEHAAVGQRPGEGRIVVAHDFEVDDEAGLGVEARRCGGYAGIP